MNEATARRLQNSIWIIFAVSLLTWLAVIGWHRWWRPALLTGLAASAFLIGTLAGFVFTSYDEESSTIGKVKDWLIGGLAGLTIVEFRSIKAVLLLFAHTNSAADYALTLSVSIVFAGLGFFFMFFGRELLFNVPLALKRAQRLRIENTHLAGVVTLQLITAIPSTILVGIDSVDALSKNSEESADLLKKLYDKDVQTFLDQSQNAIATGAPLDWDVVSKVAYLHYYRAYFSEKDTKTAQQKLALDWIIRALLINPQHIDLIIKRADTLSLLKRYRETVSILERLYCLPECPVFVEQWLGFYLLYFPSREDDVIRYCEAYLCRFPESNETRRNLASAFAQKVCREPRTHAGGLNHSSQNYKAALANLALALHDNPGYRTTMQTDWIAPDGSFRCFAHDEPYLEAVGLAHDRPGHHHTNDPQLEQESPNLSTSGAEQTSKTDSPSDRKLPARY